MLNISKYYEKKIHLYNECSARKEYLNVAACDICFDLIAHSLLLNIAYFHSLHYQTKQLMLLQIHFFKILNYFTFYIKKISMNYGKIIVANKYLLLKAGTRNSSRFR